MKVLLQKVSGASVKVDEKDIGSIGTGYLLLLGVVNGDTEEQAQWLAEKISKLRLFEGDDGTINDRSLIDMDGEVLVISQFTLAGTCKKGNRPDFTDAAPPEIAEKLYDFFISALKELGVTKVESGEFGAMMEVSLTNSGPVTLALER